jgi:CRP/FNR family transcriptional regulator, cyclic AMP receptor protein
MSQSHLSSPGPLDDLAFTQGLGPDQQLRIAEIASPIAWDAGATVFREGDSDSMLYVVQAGRVAIEITIPGRGRVTILTVGPGEVFGWSSLFSMRPKTASARTVEPTRALALDAARLRALCDTDTHLGYLLTRRILDVVSERLNATRMQLLDIYGH